MQKLCFYRFYVKFVKNTSLTMQQTSKWQTYLSYLHLEILRVRNSFSENYKIQVNNQHTDAILGNRASYMRMR